jgi:hypothetical protein
MKVLFLGLIQILTFSQFAASFDGDVTVLKTSTVGTVSFKLYPTNDNIVVDTHSGPGATLNSKTCLFKNTASDSPMSYYDCTGTVGEAFGTSLVSNFNNIEMYDAPAMYLPMTKYSRQIFVNYIMTVLIKESAFNSPDFKGIGLHYHPVGLNAGYLEDQSNKYGHNVGGSYVEKKDIKVEKSVLLKNGGRAIQAAFSIGHYYHFNGASKPSASTSATFRPNIVLGEFVSWDKVDKDYYISYNYVPKFDRSEELIVPSL